MDSGIPLLLSGALLADGRTVDVRINSGRIEDIGAAGSLSAPDRLDLGGYLLLPAPVEVHAHLDEAFSATSAPEPETVEVLQRRITEAALSGLGYGATVQRTHVRVGGGHGLVRVEAALQAAKQLHGLMDLQVVALPGMLTGAAGAEGRAMLRDALAMGVHAVGGCPSLDPDPAGYLEFVNGQGGTVDLHGGDLSWLTGLAAGANLSPCGALGLLPGGALREAVALLAGIGCSVTCLPQSNRCTGEPRAARVCAVPVGLLRAAGVAVAAGSGALRDAANPVGRVDPLEAAFLLAASGELDETAAYAAVSSVARGVLGLPPVGVEVGSPADLLAVRGESLRGVLSGGHSRVVVHGGRIVSRTSAVREYTDMTAAAVPRQGRSGPPDSP